MQKKQIIQFAVFGGVMGFIHLVQCAFRVNAHEVFLRLSASADAADNVLWHQLGNYGKLTEVVYYIVGVLFLVLIGYRLIYKKIRFRFAMGATAAAYVIPLLVGIGFRSQAPQVTNLLLPVFVSFFFAIVVVVSAGLKRNQYQKKQENK